MLRVMPYYARFFAILIDDARDADAATLYDAARYDATLTPRDVYARYFDDKLYAPPAMPIYGHARGDAGSSAMLIRLSAS